MLKEWSRKIRAWLLKPQPQLDLVRPYWDELVKQWNQHLFETTSPIGVLFLIWWFVGAPPVTLVILVVVWVFLLAGYYAWREERLKNISDNFRCWIYAMALSGDNTAAMLGDQSMKLFIGLRIVNVGPQTSIHTWQGGYRIHGRGVIFSDQFFHRGECGNLPDLIRGNNLHDDIRLFSQGETREGWIAIPAGDNPDLHTTREIMDSVSLHFTDAFDHLHEVSVLRELRRKSQL